jgi:acetyltransferase EpsM
MTTPKPVHIPLLNPNEPEARIVAINVTSGDHVHQNDVLCTLETTKSTADITAEVEGYIIGLHFHEGQIVHAGDVLCYLANSPDTAPPIANSYHKEKSTSTKAPKLSQNGIPDGLRITTPALTLARQHKLDLSVLSTGSLITEQIVRDFLDHQSVKSKYPRPEAELKPNSMIIYGGGGHGKTLIELIRSLGEYQIIGVIDDGIKSNEYILEVPVLGGNAILGDLYSSGVRLAVNAIGGIGDATIRMRVFKQLTQAGFECPAVIHPTAFIENSAVLSQGIQVFAHAYIGSESNIGYGVIVNTGSIISHGCQVGSNANISPGAILAGDVTLGEGVLVGMGVTVNLGVKIGMGARIGNGATIKSDVPENSFVKAGSTWPR